MKLDDARVAGALDRVVAVGLTASRPVVETADGPIRLTVVGAPLQVVQHGQIPPGRALAEWLRRHGATHDGEVAP